MNKERGKNIKLIKLWEILSQETSEDHPMDTNELIEKLATFGIDCTRKTLYRDIKILNESGYEILCNRKASNEYFVVDRQFDVSELRVLVDAVQAAAFITDRKTKELVDKIANLGGSRSGEVLKKNIVSFNTTKNVNEDIFYNVYEITTAITLRRKIEFTYFDYDTRHRRVFRKEGAKYIVNPYTTIYSNDNYYLVCFDDKHKNISHYRIDRMDQVSMMKEKAAVCTDAKLLDIKKHKRQVFGMFTGEANDVTFVADNSLIDVVFDKFGINVSLYDYGDAKFTFHADVQISPQFFAWVCGFGNKLKVVAPQNVVDQTKAYIKSLIDEYAQY